MSLSSFSRPALIDSEFKSFIQPLTKEEYDGLEQSILQEGCRDALISWNGILIDGHNRFEICQKHGIAFAVTEYHFDSRLDAEIWMIRNQLARRNLTDFQRAELSLALKPRIAEKAKENQRIAGKNFGENHPKQEVWQNSDKPLDTKKELAKTAGVSHDTIHKVEKIKENAIPEVIEAARSGEVSVSVAATISELPEEEQKEIIQRPKKERQQVAKDVRKKKKHQLPPIAAVDPNYKKKEIVSESFKQAYRVFEKAVLDAKFHKWETTSKEAVLAHIERLQKITIYGD